MIFTRKIFRLCVAIIISLTVFNIFYIFLNKTEGYSLFSSVFINKKVSWEDWDWINYERTRTGPGEQGFNFIETDPEILKKNEEWVKKEGFFVETSNKISITRALPDHRPAV